MKFPFGGVAFIMGPHRCRPKGGDTTSGYFWLGPRTAAQPPRGKLGVPKGFAKAVAGDTHESKPEILAKMEQPQKQLQKHVWPRMRRRFVHDFCFKKQTCKAKDTHFPKICLETFFQTGLQSQGGNGPTFKNKTIVVRGARHHRTHGQRTRLLLWTIGK